jgi:ribosomal protein S12 methylthiotransferase accessory factor
MTAARRDDPAARLETLTWLRPLARRIGITRVADLTWLDYIGMPVFQVVRPASKSLIVSQGKGLSPAQAEISGIMESIELWHAEEIPCHRRASIGEMAPSLGYSPRDLSFLDEAIDPHRVLAWVEAVGLRSGRRDHVPRELLRMDFTIQHQVHALPYRRTSTGLGTGRTRAEALLHGLHEVVERDCLSRATPVPLSLDGMPPDVRVLLEMIQRHEIQVELQYLPNRFDVPAIRAAIRDTRTAVRFWGSGCDASRERAVMKALTEAVQSRLTMISGGRDDIDEAYFLPFRYERKTEPPPAEPARGDLSIVPDHAFASAEQELDWLGARVSERAATEPLFVDLTRPELGISVCFSVVPGLIFTQRDH